MKSKADIVSALALWDDTNAQMASLTPKQRSILNCMTEENLFGSTLSNPQELNMPEIDDRSSAKSGPQNSTNKFKSNLSDSIKTEAKLTKLDTGRDFLDWLDRMETGIQAQKNSHFTVYYERVCELSHSTDLLLEQVENNLQVLGYLKEQNSSASTKSNNLHSVCDDLMTKMSSLNELKSDIESKEALFKDADKIVAQTANHLLNSENLTKLLDEIDVCLKFFRAHPTYKDSSKYDVKCRAAASKILVYVKDSFRSALERNVDIHSQSAVGDRESTSFDLFYGRLKMIAPRFHGIMLHLSNGAVPISKSALKEDFESTLQENLNIFIASRQTLVFQSLQFTLEDSVKKFERDHCSLVRSASVSLFHLLRDEESLMLEFFPDLANIGSAAQDYFDSICVIFYDHLRPKIVKLHHLETLGEISSILKVELMEHTSVSSNTETPSSTAFNASITQLWQDVQERLVYRAYIFIKTDINDFSPHDGDLLYPEKLEMMLSIGKEDSTAKSDSPADIHGMWYPTIRRTLMCLSKIYRSVEKAIFQEVAHEALKACIDSVVHASNMIKLRKTKFDGQLFLIKHLLILREQITPFNIIHSSSETSLDFSHYRRQQSLNNLVANALPEVKELHMDYRREVDRLLKMTCEGFIHEASHNVVGGLVLPMELLKTTKPATLNQKVNEAMKHMKKVVPLVQEKMSLYLANKETEFILYKPIRVSILETFSKFSKLIEENFDEQELTVIGCSNMEVLAVTLSSLSIAK